MIKDKIDYFRISRFPTEHICELYINVDYGKSDDEETFKNWVEQTRGPSSIRKRFLHEFDNLSMLLNNTESVNIINSSSTCSFDKFIRIVDERNLW